MKGDRPTNSFPLFFKDTDLDTTVETFNLVFISSKSIYINKAKELIKNNYYDYIIDVRDEEEWKKDRLITSINIPLEKIYDGVQLYELKANYLLYSNKGQKASVAAAIMRKMGYVNVQYLVGHYKLIKWYFLHATPFLQYQVLPPTNSKAKCVNIPVKNNTISIV